MSVALLQLKPSVRLTDFTDGRVADDATGIGFPADDLTRAIAAHFQEPASWDSFARKDEDKAIDTFGAMRTAGLIVSLEALSKIGPQPVAQTMFDLPRRQVGDITPGEIVFLGVPIDIGCTGAPGARFGPEALRAASVERFQCEFDLKTGRMRAWNIPALAGASLGGARMSDIGDLRHVPGEAPEMFYTRLKALMRQIYEAGAFPVVLGGDHSVTYATVPAEAEVLVHLDAHCDLADLQPELCHHHGNFIRRLLNEGARCQVHHFGLRDTSGWDTHDAGTIAKSVHDISLEGWSDAISGKSAFISLDVDVLDPTVLPGTGTPVMGGLTLPQLCAALARIVAVTRPIGLDVVELCPMLDTSQNSARVVIEALILFLALYHRIHIERDLG